MAQVRAKWLAFYAEHVEPVSKEIFSHVEKMIIGTLIVSAGAHVSSTEPMIVLFGYLRHGLIGRGVMLFGVILLLLNFVDGRNVTPPDQWSDLLFWGKFVGSDKSHHIVRPGCGWSHYPPNAIQDYDWANRVYVQTDMDDWKPDGSGRKSRINCERWGCDSLKWFVYWMQHLPGPGNDLESQGKRLNNWWTFIGAWDQAMERSLKLVGD